MHPYITAVTILLEFFLWKNAEKESLFKKKHNKDFILKYYPLKLFFQAYEGYLALNAHRLKAIRL